MTHFSRGKFAVSCREGTITMIFISNTPWKINMEPTNYPFRKENDLNQTSMIMFQPLIFRRVVPTYIETSLAFMIPLSGRTAAASPPAGGTTWFGVARRGGE